MAVSFSKVTSAFFSSPSVVTLMSEILPLYTVSLQFVVESNKQGTYQKLKKSLTSLSLVEPAMLLMKTVELDIVFGDLELGCYGGVALGGVLESEDEGTAREGSKRVL